MDSQFVSKQTKRVLLKIISSDSGNSFEKESKPSRTLGILKKDYCRFESCRPDFALNPFRINLTEYRGNGLIV